MPGGRAALRHRLGHRARRPGPGHRAGRHGQLATLLGHLGKAGADLRELRTGYRVPRQILDYANQLLGALAPGLAPASSLRQDPAALTVLPVTSQACPARWPPPARRPSRPPGLPR